MAEKIPIKEELDELRKNNIRIKALIDLYDKLMQEKVESDRDFEIKKTKAEYMRREILKATSINDKMIKKII